MTVRQPWHEMVSNILGKYKSVTTPVGLEPTASGLEVRRAIHCATGSAAKTCLEQKYILLRNFLDVLLQIIQHYVVCLSIMLSLNKQATKKQISRPSLDSSAGRAEDCSW